MKRSDQWEAIHKTSMSDRNPFPLDFWADNKPKQYPRNQYEDHMNQIKMAIIQASTPIASSLQCLQSVSYEIFLGKLSETHIRHKQ